MYVHLIYHLDNAPLLTLITGEDHLKSCFAKDNAEMTRFCFISAKLTPFAR